MTLQSSGAISMNDINVELGRSGTTTIGLNQAESGSYGAINTNSASRPNGSTPNSMNEWYGYNHNASPCFSYATADISSLSDCVTGSYPVTRYSNCGTLTAGCYVYTNSTCTNLEYVPGYNDFFQTSSGDNVEWLYNAQINTVQSAPC